MPSATSILCFDQVESIYEKKDRIERADVIFLCVPLDKTIEWLSQWAHLLEGKLIVEQTSLKAELFKVRKRKSKGTLIRRGRINLLSMHILFRPSTTTEYKDKTIAIIGEKQPGEATDVINFLQYGLQTQLVYFKTWQQHDSEMALQQALTHRVILSLGELISKTPHTTYIGKQILKLRLRIQQGDYSLYKLIQENPHLSRKLREFNTRLDKFDLAKQMKKVGDERQSTKKS